MGGAAQGGEENARREQTERRIKTRPRKYMVLPAAHYGASDKTLRAVKSRTSEYIIAEPSAARGQWRHLAAGGRKEPLSHLHPAPSFVCQEKCDIYAKNSSGGPEWVEEVGDGRRGKHMGD